MAGNVSQPAFRCGNAKTVNLSVGTASVSVQLQSGQHARHVRVYNSGTNTVFIEFGPTGVAAAVATGLPVPPGAVCIFAAAADFVAAIASVAGPAVVYFTPGEGSLV